MYPNYPFNQNHYQHDDRFFPFIGLPFLTGALVGGAAIGLTRPRPVFVSPYPMSYYRPRPFYY